MRAEILATGDEIRTGALVDSNSSYISEKLGEIGVEVHRHHCVGDHPATIERVLLEISERSELAVVTGGLGPTTDDITAEAAARAARVGLVLDEGALSDIRALFDKIGRTMGESNNKQAYLPAGAQCFRNPVGTAPGFSMMINKCRFYFVPGVPYEMKRMLSDQVLPDISERMGDGRKHFRVKTISTFGLPESTVGEEMAGVSELFPGIELGLRAKFPEIQVKLYAQGADPQELETLLESAAGWVSETFGKHVFSTTGDAMQKVVGDLLLKENATIALAESCTGGLIANWLTNVAGSSDYFLFSGVTYSNAAKCNIFGVTPETITQYGAVHENTVREMAEGARRVVGAKYGLATSGIAGPGGGTDEKPVGTLCVGLAAPAFTRGKRFTFQYGQRLMNKQRFAMTALEMLRRELLGIGGA
ncbi:MAG: competence/damage-inducible protein A [Desulfobacteraceae bacterium]|nr:competence/damage-inducible protein A [Desulfobacteraceae bacterium]